MGVIQAAINNETSKDPARGGVILTKRRCVTSKSAILVKFRE